MSTVSCVQCSTSLQKRNNPFYSLTHRAHAVYTDTSRAGAHDTLYMYVTNLNTHYGRTSNTQKREEEAEER